jgi:hypothetical protein
MNTPRPTSVPGSSANLHVENAQMHGCARAIKVYPKHAVGRALQYRHPRGKDAAINLLGAAKAYIHKCSGRQTPSRSATTEAVLS